MELEEGEAMTFEMGCEDWATNEYLLTAINTEYLHGLLLCGISSKELFFKYMYQYFKSLEGEYPDFKFIDNWYLKRAKEMKEER